MNFERKYIIPLCKYAKIKLQFTYNKQTAILFCCLGREFVSIAHFGQEFDTHQAYFLLGVIIAQLLDCLVERV